MLCFGIFVIVGFWSHLKIAMCFAYLVAKKMQEEKQWENLLDLGWCSCQGYQFRTVSAGTAGIYRTGQQSGTLDPPVSYRKKYRPYRPRTGQFRAIPAGTEKSFFIIIFFYLSFVIFEFLLGQNGNLFALTY